MTLPSRLALACPWQALLARADRSALGRRQSRQLPADQCNTGFEAENGRNI
jgi:hypothetical protein